MVPKNFYVPPLLKSLSVHVKISIKSLLLFFKKRTTLWLRCWTRRKQCVALPNSFLFTMLTLFIHGLPSYYMCIWDRYPTHIHIYRLLTGCVWQSYMHNYGSPYDVLVTQAIGNLWESTIQKDQNTLIKQSSVASATLIGHSYISSLGNPL